MKTQRIIEVYKMQSSSLNSTVCKDTWFEVMKIKLNRTHLIQVLEHLGHCDSIIKEEKRRLEWYKLNSWSDLVSMTDAALELNTDSYLNTIY